MIKNFKNSKGFTLIELIVVIAILAILVLLASPRFFGRTQEAVFTKHISNAKVIQNASELYFMDEDDWPRLSDEPYTSEEIEEYAESVYTLTGETIELDPNGNYYDINYNALNDYVSVNDEDKPYYILQNPVGKVYYMEGLSELGKNRFESNKDNSDNSDYIEYIEVSTPEDLYNIRNNLNGKYIQINDIDLTSYSEGKDWLPIGEDGNEFKGIYNGGEFKINGLTIEKNNNDYSGLFGKINGAKVQDIKLTNVNISGENNTGGLVGYSQSSEIKNVELTNINVTGENNTGGLIGYSNSSKIIESYVNGIVNGLSLNTGGLVGRSVEVQVSDSHSNVEVFGRSRTGGIIGSSDSSEIIRSSSEGNVTSSSSLVGGLIGRFDGSQIDKSFSKSVVKGNSKTGGLVGEIFSEDSRINNSYSTGNIEGGIETGGLVGRMNRGGITNSYSVGNVMGGNWSGGFIGYNQSGFIRNSYTTGNSRRGGTTLSEEEMKNENSFEDWNFESIWKITPGDYPTLR